MKHAQVYCVMPGGRRSEGWLGRYNQPVVTEEQIQGQLIRKRASKDGHWTHDKGRLEERVIALPKQEGIYRKGSCLCPFPDGCLIERRWLSVGLSRHRALGQHGSLKCL